MFAKSLLDLELKQKLNVDTTLDYANAPLCKYNKGACLCKRSFQIKRHLTYHHNYYIKKYIFHNSNDSIQI